MVSKGDIGLLLPIHSQYIDVIHNFFIKNIHLFTNVLDYWLNQRNTEKKELYFHCEANIQ